MKTLCEDQMTIPFVSVDLFKDGIFILNGTSNIDGDLKFENIRPGLYNIIIKNTNCINDTTTLRVNEEKKNYLSIYIACKICEEAYSKPQLKFLNDAISTDSAKATVYFDRGVFFLMEGKYKKALEDFNKAIKLKPEYAEAYNERTNAKRDGQFNEQLNIYEDYNKAIALNPRLAKAYYDRGVAKNYNESKLQPTVGCSDICKAYELGYPRQLIELGNNCDCNQHRSN